MPGFRRFKSKNSALKLEASAGEYLAVLRSAGFRWDYMPL
jgi:hypothetical protein